MLALKYLLMLIGLGLLGSATGLVVYDVYVAEQLRRLIKRKANGETDIPLSDPPPPFAPVRWRQAQRLAAAAVLPVLLALSIVVIPDGSAGVRISQIWGARPGTLYPGVHLVTPLIDSVSLYDTREQVYQTQAVENDKKVGEVLAVQAREGLNIGLAVSVRYRLDPRRLDSIHTNLPQPVGEQVVAPVVSTIYRQLAPNYMTREIFATKREELRSKAAELITARLASDGIVVREVLLRDLQLPEEYAKGLEGLLLKEQEDERLGTETDIKFKEVKIAELEAEAQKARSVKQAEAQAQVRVLQAKAESDAMQYTLAAEAEADRADQAGGPGAQGSHAAKRGSRGAGQSDRQQSGSGTPEEFVGGRGQSHPRDGCGGFRADEVRGGGAEVESDADSEDHCGTAVGQAADHDGTDGRQEFFCQRRDALGVFRIGQPDRKCRR